MKKPLLIIIFLLLVGIGVAVFVKFPQSNDKTQSQEFPLSGATEVIQSGDHPVFSGNILTGAENPLVYTNTEFWFQLTLPEWWEDYEIFSYQPSEEVQSFYSGLIQTIKITLPTQEAWWPWIPNPALSNRDSMSDYITWHVDAFSIVVRTPAWYHQEYQRCTPNPDPSCFTDLLWFNNNYYFSYFLPQDIAIDLVDLLTEKGEWLNYETKISQTFRIL